MLWAETPAEQSFQKPFPAFVRDQLFCDMGYTHDDDATIHHLVVGADDLCAIRTMKPRGI